MDPYEKIVRAYAKVEKVSRMVWGGDPLPERISVDDLHAVVQHLYGVSIEMRSVKYEAHHAKSLVERWPGNKAIVAVQHDRPETMRRYATVKELCHLIIDEPDDFSTDGCDTIDGLLYVRNLDLSAPENTAIRSEKLAEAMADELVYPNRFRRADMANVKNPEHPLTLANLALTYGIPDFVPSRVLRPLTMELRDRIWASVEALKRE